MRSAGYKQITLKLSSICSKFPVLSLEQLAFHHNCYKRLANQTTFRGLVEVAQPNSQARVIRNPFQTWHPAMLPKIASRRCFSPTGVYMKSVI